MSGIFLIFLIYFLFCPSLSSQENIFFGQGSDTLSSKVNTWTDPEMIARFSKLDLDEGYKRLFGGE